MIHSATKWIGGHGTTIGGVVVDAGKFDWNQGRFDTFTKPDESYHGLRYDIDAAGAEFATKLCVQGLRDFGPCLDADSAFNFLQGLGTLHLRIQRHGENSQKVAKFLLEHPSVDWMTFTGLESHQTADLAKKYLKNEAGRRVIDNVKVWSHVGDAR